eukprot:4699838-Prymnesium_polylepis.2
MHKIFLVVARPGQHADEVPKADTQCPDDTSDVRSNKVAIQRKENLVPMVQSCIFFHAEPPQLACAGCRSLLVVEFLVRAERDSVTHVADACGTDDRAVQPKTLEWRCLQEHAALRR